MSDSSHQKTGGCLCGAVRFTADTPESGFHACHCGMCRRWSSGPVFVTHAHSIEFEGRDAITEYDSSEWAQRAFCRHCGSNLYYRFKPNNALLLSVGAFDDAEGFTLTNEVFVDHQPEGYRFAGELNRMTEADVMSAGEPPG